MPTRAKSTRARARKTTRTVRAPANKKVQSAVTVAAKQIRDTVKEVRTSPVKLKKLGKAAAAVAGVVTAGLLLRRKH